MVKVVAVVRNRSILEALAFNVLLKELAGVHGASAGLLGVYPVVELDQPLTSDRSSVLGGVGPGASDGAQDLVAPSR